jgi:hypothetical protein
MVSIRASDGAEQTIRPYQHLTSRTARLTTFWRSDVVGTRKSKHSHIHFGNMRLKSSLGCHWLSQAANGKIEFDPLIEQIGLDLATFSPS